MMNSGFKDLYSVMQEQAGETSPEKQHPALTTFKYREKEGWVKRTVDYIFIAKNRYFNKNNIPVIKRCMDPSDLEKEALLNTEIGYPSPDHPSDHFSIAYKVFLKYPGVMGDKIKLIEPQMSS